MRCLAEPIACAANAEDGCNGRFWQGRFKAQRLCDDRAVLAAMAYVDLNPVRAGLTRRLDGCEHTSLKRHLETLTDVSRVQPLRPIAGSVAACLPVKLGEYLALVEWTGQQVRSGKRGALPRSTPAVLTRIEPKPERWPVRVRGIGSRYWRVAGEVEDLTARARDLQQRWLKGIGLAAKLSYSD
ncbi:hypothetical protein LVB77_00645 [Lysobacter sp. 5GHs7-4]|uniref:hypothetical protein n=1 Tax=Lysobacter sp. 5GHs7-4 TaxID=2904253 RepID=UPI001E44F36F|nr:hypothetical protein [Lysobacter sp. 5GHs7-4]UHQ23255.1 hypothetical protein LVB77_00645 [Lysobacter sp. 5GHs7-4]